MPRHCFWSLLLVSLAGFFFLAADPVQARRNPDPLAILKSLPPPTVEYDWGHASGTPLLPKPPLNPPGPKPASKTVFIRIPVANATAAGVLPKPTHLLASGTPTGSAVGSKPVSLSSLPLQTAKASGVAAIGTATVSAPPKAGSASLTVKVAESPTPPKPESPKGPQNKPPATSAATIATAQATSTIPTPVPSSPPDKKPVGSAQATTTVALASDASAIAASGTVAAPTGSSPAAIAEVNASGSAEPAAAGETKPEDDEEAGGAEEKPAPGPPPEIMAKAEDYLKQAKWKELDAVFRENPALYDDLRGAQIRIEYLLNQAKLNTIEIKRIADIALSKDPKDPYGNLGLGVFFMDGKKPDSTKALKHLSIAAAAKKPPAGVSARLWKARAKAYWLYILLILGGIGAGIDNWRKKRKAATVALGPDGTPLPPAQPAEPEPEEPPPTDLPGKIRHFLKKLFKKAPAAAVAAENPVSAPTDAGTSAGAEAPTGFLGKIKSLLSRLRRKPSSDIESQPPAAPVADSTISPETKANGAGEPSAPEVPPTDLPVNSPAEKPSDT